MRQEIVPKTHAVCKIQQNAPFNGLYWDEINGRWDWGGVKPSEVPVREWGNLNTDEGPSFRQRKTGWAPQPAKKVGTSLL
jgi:hypothetical protein